MRMQQLWAVTMMMFIGTETLVTGPAREREVQSACKPECLQSDKRLASVPSEVQQCVPPVHIVAQYAYVNCCIPNLEMQQFT
jgi:hypothetical protein